MAAVLHTGAARSPGHWAPWSLVYNDSCLELTLSSCLRLESNSDSFLLPRATPDTWGHLAFRAHLCVVGPLPPASSRGKSRHPKSFVCLFIWGERSVEVKISTLGVRFSRNELEVDLLWLWLHHDFPPIQFNPTIIRSIKFF